jgi:ribosomal protein L31E
MAEKEYVIRYNDAVRIPRTRFANKVLQATRAFVKKHTHANNGDIRISADVNAAIWERGMNHKLNKLNVVIRKKDGNVWVFTPEGKDLKAFEKAATPTKKKETKPAKTTASKAKAKSEQ